MKPHVYITRRIMPEAMEIVEAACRWELNESDTLLSAAQLVAGLRGKAGVICMISDKFTAAVMEALPDLCCISTISAGFDHIDVAAATERGVMVTNTPGGMDNATAEITWALLLSLARHIPQGDRFTRGGHYTEYRLNAFLGHELCGKTLGVAGMGRIGRAVARRARGFDMRVLYTDVVRLGEDEERELGVAYADKDTLLAESDFVSLHVPLTEETRHYLSRREFGLMKKTALVVNASRGPVLDEQALVWALKTGEIDGAALDVYETEPYVHPALRALENVVLVPHLGSSTIEARVHMTTLAARNVVAGVTGERPPHLVNPEVWEKRRGAQPL